MRVTLGMCSLALWNLISLLDKFIGFKECGFSGCPWCPLNLGACWRYRTPKWDWLFSNLFWFHWGLLSNLVCCPSSKVLEPWYSPDPRCHASVQAFELLLPPELLQQAEISGQGKVGWYLGKLRGPASVLLIAASFLSSPFPASLGWTTSKRRAGKCNWGDRRGLVTIWAVFRMLGEQHQKLVSLTLLRFSHRVDLFQKQIYNLSSLQPARDCRDTVS